MTSDTKNKFDFKNLFIFEMANNHQGSVAHGKKIIAEMGAIAKKYKLKAAVKLQFRDLDSFIHSDYINDKDNKHISRFLSTRLSEKDFKELVKETKKQGLLAMSTPFDEKSVDLIEKLDIDIIKIASCSAKDWPLLEKVILTDKPIVVSTGGLILKEIDNLASFFEHHYKNFAIMHCVAIYPTTQEKLKLNQIQIMDNRYSKITIGFSTHEEPENYEAIQQAYAKGARIFERHVGIPTGTITLNKYSSTPVQIAKWIEAYKRAESACGPDTFDTRDNQERDDLLELMRGVYVKKDIKKGQKISDSDVFFSIPIQKGQLNSGEFKKGMIADDNYKKNAPLGDKMRDNKVSDKHIIYQVIHDVKGMLNEARIPIQEGGEFDVELSHHYGIGRLNDTGVVIISCINREYCKKVLVQLPGQKNPSHYHKKKEETFHLLSGELKVDLQGKQKTLHPGDMVVVERGVMHNFWTDTGAIFEEISTTNFNDDSIYEDSKINKMNREDRKTKLINWGYHQFD